MQWKKLTKSPYSFPYQFFTKYNINCIIETGVFRYIKIKLTLTLNI